MTPKITIVELGLIGGSLGMAIRKKKLGRVIGLTRDKEKAALAVKMKAVDYASTNIKGLIQDADIIFICYPIYLIIPEIQKIRQFLKPGTIVTDVGSTKGFIVKHAERLMPRGVFFVGGHPMAGKELTGIDVADADLFKGNKYILTKTPKTDPKALSTLKSLVTKIGAKPVILDPESHDEIVAGISHMPVAVAAALIESVSGAGKLSDDMKDLAASGFRDTTRIASGDPQLGSDMFTTNRSAVLSALKNFKKALAEIEKLVRQGDPDRIRNKLSEAKDFRDSIYK